MNPITNFEDISYLNEGNPRQKRAYEVLSNNRILESLWEFDPILVGTIPINIDIENSDLDVICYVKDHVQFEQHIVERFGNMVGFKIRKNSKIVPPAVVASFKIDGFDIEIFGQNIPTKKQLAYRHMVIEYKLINKYGEGFRLRIIQLKKEGHKTEPAFAFELGLKGDPYEALLEFETPPSK